MTNEELEKAVNERVKELTDQKNRIIELIDWCCEAVETKEWEPGEFTYCNIATNFILEKMGINGFRGMGATQMVEKLRKEWEKTTIEKAQDIANDGHIVVSCQYSPPISHVAVVRPGVVGWSNKWGKPSPKLANVGASNFISKTAGWAYKDEPEFYVKRLGK